MNKNVSPDIRPIDEITYEFPQSKYELKCHLGLL